MYLRIVTFTLNGIDADHYEQLAAEVAPGFASWDGLQAKFWLADRATSTFGGVYLFDTPEAADASRQSDLYRGMVTNPAFADIEVREFHVLDAPTARTTTRLLATPH